MTPQPLIRLRFAGRRFDAHTLPLTLLRDIEALQGIVSILARDELQRQYPDRKRMPRGLGESLTLHLTTNEEGSFIAGIGLLLATAFFPHTDPAFGTASRALDRLHDVLASVDEPSVRSREPLPAAIWPLLERFGRGLREDERLELNTTDGRTVHLTPEIRRRLLMTRPGAQSVTEAVDLLVQLAHVRPEESTLSVRMIDNRVFLMPVAESDLYELNDVRVGDFDTTWLRVQAIVTVDAAGVLQSIQEVQRVERLASSEPRVQLALLGRLKDGWLDGLGSAVESSLIRRVADWFDEFLAENLPLPRIYPTPEGGVQAEWLLGRLDLSLEFDPQSAMVHWHALQLDTDEVDEDTAALHDDKEWRKLGEKLRQTLEHSASIEDAAPRREE